jgi:GMP synthase (glutamine-hydrolysing)
LLIVLGGPIGVYETDAYPFLAEDIAVLERLARGRPSLSICLGCQLMARALGARVFPGPVKEIGRGGVDLPKRAWSRACGPLAEEAATVLHWHGDTFDLPSGAVRLAANQLPKHPAIPVCRGEGPVSTRLSRSRRVSRTAAVGHEERFLPPRLSGGYGLG